MIVGLCERFHCLPSQLLAEDVSFLKMLKTVNIARPEGG